MPVACCVFDSPQDITQAWNEYQAVYGKVQDTQKAVSGGVCNEDWLAAGLIHRSRRLASGLCTLQQVFLTVIVSSANTKPPLLPSSNC